MTRNDSYNALLSKVTKEYIYSLDKANLPSKEDIEVELLALSNKAINEYNLGPEAEDADEYTPFKERYPNRKFGSDRIPSLRVLSPLQIADLMIALDNVCRISTSKENRDPDYDVISIYNTDGYNKGTYTSDEDSLRRLARAYNYTMTIPHFSEIMTALRDRAPWRTRCFDKDLVAVNNGIFNYATKQLMPFDKEYVFITKSHVDYVDNAPNPIITMPDGEVYGLNIRFPMNYENEALQVASGKPIHISTKNLRYGALSVANGELDLFGRYPNTMKNPLILKNVKVSLFDGELTVPQLTFPQSKMATLSFTNIDLAQVLALAQYNQVTLTGRANATLPFWLGHKECLICNGTLEQVGNVSIKLTDEMVKGLKKGGWTENILVDLLKEMELKNSHATVTLDPKGQMTLRASISGFNPTKRTNNPITLNYTHQENMFELWNMIDYGSQFEQNLQYKLYKQLDKDK